MNDEDTFAVWMAAAVLRADGDAFAAATLKHVASKANADARWVRRDVTA